MQLSYLSYLLFAVVAYLLGAIPFGLLLGHITRGIDIRHYGSGNTGATNALRTLGWQASAIVFVLDIAKAVVPVLLARWLISDPAAEVICALAAIAGHNWPVYIGWKGGKGVSSSMGVMLLFSPLTTTVGIVLAAGLIVWSRYVSLGSVAGAVIVALLTLAYAIYGSGLPGAYVAFSLVAALLVVVRHRSNIARILAGNERKLGESIKLRGETAHERP